MSQISFVIITGHPATGKTTLAKSLSAALSYPLLDKDSLIEKLADVLGCNATRFIWI